MMPASIVPMRWRIAVLVLVGFLCVMKLDLENWKLESLQESVQGHQENNNTRRTLVEFSTFNAMWRNFTATRGKITLVLQANVAGGTAFFLQQILTPACVVVTPVLELPPVITKYSLVPTSDLLAVKLDNVVVRPSAELLLFLLSNNSGDFDKVFINHPLGFPIEFLHGLLDMNKRFMSVTHDYVWVLDKIQPTFAELRTPEGASRNYAFKKMLPKIEMKSQNVATKSNFELMDRFKTMHVVPMPDYVDSTHKTIETAPNLVIGVIGDLPPIKGIDSVLAISRQVANSEFCAGFDIGHKYIQFGKWRLGQVDSTHFSFSHQHTRTPVVFSSDGSIHLKPGDIGHAYSLWQRGDECELRRVTFGQHFVQIGDWRLGVSFGDLILSHRSNTSVPIVLGRRIESFQNEIRYVRDNLDVGYDLWKQEVGPAGTSKVVVRGSLIKMDNWFLWQKEDELVIVHKTYGKFQSIESTGHTKEYHRGSGDMSMILSKSGWCRVPRNVQVVVFGAVSTLCRAGDNFHSHRFENIVQFNSLLRRFQPNVLLVTAIWPETYSYTLTLAMLTNIPIIVRKTATDFRAAIFERAKRYPKAHFHDFENIESVVTLARNIKATSLTEVRPQFFVPPQWKNLMHPHLFNAVLIPSTIITGPVLSICSATELICRHLTNLHSGQNRFASPCQAIFKLQSAERISC